MAKSRHSRRVNRAERIQATPETRAKIDRGLDRDLVETLRLRRDERGDACLSPEQVSAAYAIRAAYNLITADVAARIAVLGRMARGKRSWSDAQGYLVERYDEWATRVERAGIRHWRVLDVVVDNEARLGLEPLRLALDLWRSRSGQRSAA